MTAAELPLVLLLVFTLVAAVMVVRGTTDLLAAVISFGAVGFGLSVIFMLLGAPDVAITQIVVEVIALVILIRATIGRDTKQVTGEHEPFTVAWGFVLALVILVIVAGILMQPGMPEFGKPVMERLAGTPSSDYLAKGMEETGAPNAVTAILLDFRGYDTLGEATVLFAAVVGAVVLLRRRARNKGEQGNKETR